MLGANAKRCSGFMFIQISVVIDSNSSNVLAPFDSEVAVGATV